VWGGYTLVTYQAVGERVLGYINTALVFGWLYLAWDSNLMFSLFVLIFAVCPHNKSNYVSAIKNTVAAVDNSRIRFLDYSTGIISPEETCDSCHLNPGGAVKLAVKLSVDIQNFAGLLEAESNKSRHAKATTEGCAKQTV
jgi:hypothetical protein